MVSIVTCTGIELVKEVIMAVSSLEFIIPEGEIQHFKQVVKLSIASLQQIAGQLHDLTPTLDATALSHSICQQTELSLDDIVPLIAQLWRWAIVQRRMDVDSATFLEVLRSSLITLSYEIWSIEDRQCWDDRIPLFLNMMQSDSALGTSAKAGELLLMQGTIFSKARIITDIRPVFNDQGDQIQGYIPFHSLIITTIEDGDEHHIQLALAFNELKQLEEQIERAMTKERIVRDQFTANAITLINTGSEPNA